MIDLKNITKSFGTLQVLKGIDLHIDKGEIVSIVGPSGAGKTTLLQIIGTLDRPDTGSVCVDSVDVTTLSQKALSDFRNQNLGFVFQFHQLLPEFTAIENIMIPAFIAGRPTKEAKARAEELLQFMGLTERANHKPAELSGGEKQRIAVARALVNNPKVILADEPSGSLDSKNKQELHQLFFDLRDKFGQTFVIVTHDEQLATLTDRTIHMRDGILENSETTETTENPETPESPEQPEQPEQPDYPEQPEQPEQPDYPENPEIPETTETPENPENPETSETTETPENPELPENPAPPPLQKNNYD